MRHAPLTAAALVLLGSAADADTIHLRNGGVLRDATVVGRLGDTVEIEVRAGGGRVRMSVVASDIERIEPAAPPPPAADGTPADPVPGTAAAAGAAPPALARAFACLREGRPVEAELLLRPLVVAGPWQVPARYGCSLACEARGDLAGAEKEARLAAILAPGDPWLAFHRAHLRHAAGDLPAAVAGYKRAAALDPEDLRLRDAVRAALAEAAGGQRPGDAVVAAREQFDRALGNVADAADAATAVLAEPALALRTACASLRVEVTAPPAALAAYGRGGPVADFRRTVTAVHAVLQIAPAYDAADVATRELLMLQVQSALAHRYGGARVVVEAKAGALRRATAEPDGATVRVRHAVAK